MARIKDTFYIINTKTGLTIGQVEAQNNYEALMRFRKRNFKTKYPLKRDMYTAKKAWVLDVLGVELIARTEDGELLREWDPNELEFKNIYDDDRWDWDFFSSDWEFEHWCES